MIEKSNKKGFTLVELLVVLAIIGIMSAMVLPRLAGSLGSLNQKTATRKVCAALRYARSKAVSEGAMLVASVDKERGYLVITDKPDLKNKGEEFVTTDKKNRRTQYFSYSLPEGVFFEKTDDPGAEWTDETLEILFYPTGRATGGRFFLTQKDKSPLSVSVDKITGTVSIGS